MRGIRFRGKRVYNGEWTEGYYVCVWGMHLIFTGQIAIDMEDEDAENRIVNHEVLPETVGQYTGLTDKNGVKIFEGDIVEYDEEIGKVVYITDDASFDIFFDTWNTYFSVIDGKYIEVIGNIHDNPELLKRGEENG